MRGPPVRSDTKAIWRPSGDHVGSVSMAGCRVSRRKTPVPTFSTYTSGLPSLDRVRATCWPSGLQAGDVLIPENAESTCSGRRSKGKIRYRSGYPRENDVKARERASGLQAGLRFTDLFWVTAPAPAPS